MDEKEETMTGIFIIWILQPANKWYSKTINIFLLASASKQNYISEWSNYYVELEKSAFYISHG